MRTFLRNEKILDREKTALLLIDIQEKVLAVMSQPELVVSNSLKLIKGFKILRVPVFITEQYPKGLGPTEDRIKKELGDITPIQKMSFSCFGADNLFEKLSEENISQIVAAGIETHVCVQQTVLDLLSNGFQVNVAADGVSSRKTTDYRIALERMRNNGAEITTTESILFELLNVSGTDEFKTVSKIIK